MSMSFFPTTIHAFTRCNKVLIDTTVHFILRVVLSNNSYQRRNKGLLMSCLYLDQPYLLLCHTLFLLLLCSPEIKT